jgi:fumarylacetoacetate (FAA) hydrolase
VRLATARNGTPDGELVLVDRTLGWAVAAGAIARNLQDALDRWGQVLAPLQKLSGQLDAGQCPDARPLDPEKLEAPLPRAFAWLDGTSYLSHMARARELRGVTMPADFSQEPLMGERIGLFLGPRDPLPLLPGDIGMDIEGEIAVITGAVPVGASIAQARAAIRMVTMVNDTSLRTVLADTIQRGRSATLAAKPWPTMAPVAITPDALGDLWDGDLLRARMNCHVNGTLLAAPDASVEASFTFPQLIAYCARYRPLPCGTVLAVGTISNADDMVGGACIAERRCIEQRQFGAPVTPYLEVGHNLRIDMFDANGASIFGAIAQTVVAAH